MKYEKTIFFCFTNAASALLLGLLIYLCFGESTYLNQLFNIKILIGAFPLLRYYVPDFLWAYSLTFMLAPFCGSILAGILASGFGIFWETMQMIGYINGTFDMVDITMYITASIVAVLIIFLFNRRKEV